MGRRTATTNRRLIGTALGTPLAASTISFVGGKIPATRIAGDITNKALAPNVPLIGAVTSVSFGGVVINQLGKISRSTKKQLRGF